MSKRNSGNKSGGRVTNTAGCESVENNSTAGLEMVVCEDCGHSVPEMNLRIHKARACQSHVRVPGGAGSTTHGSSSRNHTRIRNRNDRTAPASPSTATRSTATSNLPSQSRLQNRPKNGKRTVSDQRKRQQHDYSYGEQAENEDSEDMQCNELAHLLEQDETDKTNSNNNRINSYTGDRGRNDAQHEEEDEDGTDDDDNKGHEEEEWSCPRCTLLNSIHQSCCDACQFHNHELSNTTNHSSSTGIRDADPIRTERLIHDDYYSLRPSPPISPGVSGESIDSNDDIDNNPALYWGTGALLGTVLGAAGAYARGRPVSSGAFEGAMTGVVGGAFLNEVFGAPSPFPRDTTNATRSASETDAYNNNFLEQAQLPSPYSLGNSGASQNQELLSRSRTSAAIGQPGYPSMTNSAFDNNQNNNSGRNATTDERTRTSTSTTTTNAPNSTQQQPRPSFRVIRRQVGPSGYFTTIISGPDMSGIETIGGNPNNMYVNNSNEHSSVEHDAMLRHMLQSIASGGTGILPSGSGFLLSSSSFEGGAGSGGGVHGMSYEQLLNMFGDGTENLAANERDIHSLPTAIINNPQKELPEDARKCAICLDEYETKEVRKTLPCLHGFHEHCVDKWLRTNGACPVCKHRLRE